MLRRRDHQDAVAGLLNRVITLRKLLFYAMAPHTDVYAAR